jgi:ketosteroid isomerase-like protein
MSANTLTTFDFASFCRAVEGRDSDTQLAMYAPDATVTIVDRLTPPGAPRVLSGRDEIRAWIEDIDGREMTHAVGHGVNDEHGAAFTEACRYPDGTNVMCATVLKLADGRIVDQTVLQAWDES